MSALHPDLVEFKFLKVLYDDADPSLVHVATGYDLDSGYQLHLPHEGVVAESRKIDKLPYSLLYLGGNEKSDFQQRLDILKQGLVSLGLSQTDEGTIPVSCYRTRYMRDEQLRAVIMNSKIHPVALCLFDGVNFQSILPQIKVKKIINL